MTCADCKFSKLVNIGSYTCHRFPPIIVPIPPQPVIAYPQVRADDWCGEGVKKISVEI